MKLTFLTPALVAILGLALASAPITVQAQTPAAAPAATPAAAPAKAPKAKKPTNYGGTLTTIAADSSSVVVTSSKKTLTLALTAKTVYKKDKKAATLADFAVGDKVTGSFSTDATGAMSAVSLYKTTAKKAAPKAAATSATPAPAAAAPATN